MPIRSSLRIQTPQAQCRAGVARRDITPPVGIYHRMWGAATHDRATGVHRPLLATVLVLCPSGEPGSGSQVGPGNAVVPRRDGSIPITNQETVVIVTIDHCLLWDEELRRLRDTICHRTQIPESCLQIAFSHTHAAGLMDRTRAALPGGELIGPYLDTLAETLAAAVRDAMSSLQPATLVYGTGSCSLAAHRDTWDAERHLFVCGYNPSGPTDSTVMIARVADASGAPIAVMVNYACHPTTLAWDNTLISPDYIGAMRETVESVSGGLCLFLQGASGDLGPREGFVGDSAVADRNGRELAWSVLSALESLPAAATEFVYQGPVISGATIGTWKHEAISQSPVKSMQSWRSRHWTVPIPWLPGLPTRESTAADLKRWTEAERKALSKNDAAEARDCRAQIERMNRQLTRLRQLPEGDHFPVPIHLHQIGDGYWLWLEGEYYQLLQKTLRERLGSTPLIVSTVVNGWRPSYLPDRDTYGKQIYQEQIAVLAPGCLEMIIDEVARQLDEWQSDRVSAS